MTQKRGAIAAVRVALALFAILVVAVGLTIYSIAGRGLSAREEPGRAEAMLATAMRRLATPAAVRSQANPVAASAEVLDEALQHYADHCASCHGSNGAGDTAIGRGLYPKAPDMRADGTQSLTDGELFSIIENGIRLTGMPAWGNGTPDGERDSWGLVHFIRRLPTLSDEEVERVEALGPKTPAQLKEEEEIRRFLSGESEASAPAPAAPHGGHEE
jgi:mono/diheme cytochrome c family protein